MLPANHILAVIEHTEGQPRKTAFELLTAARNLAGTLLLVGKGTLAPADVRRILELRDRSAAGPTAPASGLFLVAVEY